MISYLLVCMIYSNTNSQAISQRLSSQTECKKVEMQIKQIEEYTECKCIEIEKNDTIGTTTKWSRK